MLKKFYIGVALAFFNSTFSMEHWDRASCTQPEIYQDWACPLSTLLFGCILIGHASTQPCCWPVEATCGGCVVSYGLNFLSTMLKKR